ncbi:Regulator [Azospirillaceae bacterium]
MIHEEQTSHHVSLPMTPSCDFSSVRVLIIDDEPFCRATLRQQLRQLGCQQVAEAEDGESGLRQATQFEPDVILCDIAMEPMDGIDFVSALRAGSWSHANQAPVIFITSHSRIDIVRKAAKIGVSAFLVKPILLNALKEKIGAALAN